MARALVACFFPHLDPQRWCLACGLWQDPRQKAEIVNHTLALKAGDQNETGR